MTCERCLQPFETFDSIEPTASQFGVSSRSPGFRHTSLSTCVEALARAIAEKKQ